MRSLSTYQRKRDFQQTKEPRGAARQRKQGFSFVVQKHEARRLHYDFRLELDGVLLSWAVPKGPSLDPTVKRLAQQTEDHPLEYGGFEGTIPKGQYGGGTVMLWDRGTWSPEGDPRKGYEKGHLAFELDGERMRGRWHLVRTGREGRSWLLFKSRDEASSTEGDSLVEGATTSVLTSRTMDEIAQGKSAPKARSARGRSEVDGEAARAPRQKAARASATAKRVAGASPSTTQKTAAPSAPEPQLATLVDEVPEGDEWIHEVKFDGYRLLAVVHRNDARLFTRGGNDWTDRMPAVAAALNELPVSSAILDGELVAVGDDGISEFQRLQNALGTPGSAELAYCAFDLLHLDGHDLRELPVEQRKELLRTLLDKAGVKLSKRGRNKLPAPLPRAGGVLRYSDHVVGHGPEFFEAARELGLEGIISKHKSSAYRPGRSREWLKIKCISRQEFVIGGYTEPSGSRKHLGALLVGLWKDGELVYSGKVGTGFTDASLRELRGRLEPLERKRTPFSDPPRGAEARGVHWVEPKCIAEIAFTELTEGHRLRHPSFHGLREDKPSTDVHAERPQSPAGSQAARNERAPALRGDTPTAKASTAGKSAARAARDSLGGVKLSNPQKVLYPEEGITKNDVFSYYAAIAAYMLPHIVDRPLTLVRCPEGYKKQCFFQKHVAKGRPEALRPVPIVEKTSKEEYLALDDDAGIGALVQMGVLEIHTWGSRARNVECPDLLVFDLDPDVGLPWERVSETALLLRRLFEELDLASYVKTTGGKGLHVCVPVVPRFEWDDIKTFCQNIAESLARLAPERYVATVSKARRSGKIFIDYLRNGRGATFIAPYSTRARAGAPVATPIEWDEIDEVGAKPFTIATVPGRLEKLGRDPWSDMHRTRQGLSAARLRSVAAAARKA